MEITFDELKRRTNMEKHGFDFAELDHAFFVAARIYPGKRDRQIAVGNLGQITIAVVFRPLGSEALSVISMRTASLKERSMP
ncbi:MAG: BrnT family toxin [Devosia sp.]|nr:BrnT family toxin [Devosia sp.]